MALVRIFRIILALIAVYIVYQHGPNTPITKERFGLLLFCVLGTALLS